MKILTSLIALCLFAFSAGATESRAYTCDSLENPYATFSIQVEDGVVILKTVHGGPKGLHSTTNVVMHHIDSTDDSEVYRAAGITATFRATLLGRSVHKTLTIEDRYGHSAACR